jgi:hypothetical protein
MDVLYLNVIFLYVNVSPVPSERLGTMQGIMDFAYSQVPSIVAFQDKWS